MKFLEENIGSNLTDIGLSNIFVSDFKGKGNKSKNKQMRPDQTKTFFPNKGNCQQNDKATY